MRMRGKILGTIPDPISITVPGSDIAKLRHKMHGPWYAGAPCTAQTQRHLCVSDMWRAQCHRVDLLPWYTSMVYSQARRRPDDEAA